MSIRHVAAIAGASLFMLVLGLTLAAAGAVFGDILGLWHLGTAC